MFAPCNLHITGLFQGEHSEFFARMGVGCWKSGFRRTKALISLKRGKIGPRLLLRSNTKSYTRFRLVLKSVTLDDLEGSLCTLFQNTRVKNRMSQGWGGVIFWTHTVVFTVCAQISSLEAAENYVRSVTSNSTPWNRWLDPVVYESRSPW